MATYKLELEKFMFPQVSCVANHEHMPNAKEMRRRRPETELEYQYQVDKEVHRIIVDLTISSVDVNDLDPYNFKIQVFGVFGIQSSQAPAKDFEKDLKKGVFKELVMNAIQILAGACRDMIHTLSGKGPYGAVALPLIFLSLEDIPDPQESPAPDGAK